LKPIASRSAEPAARLREAAERLEAGNGPEAVALCEGVLRSHPRHPGALHLLGVAFTRMARLPEAIEALEAAAIEAPASAACRVALGVAWRKRGDPARACTAFEEALRLAPNDLTALFNLALAAGDAGDTERSVRLLRAVTRANPMDFEAAQLLVDRLAQQVRDAETAPQTPLEGPQRASPAAPELVTIGFCSVQPEREERARASFTRALGPVPCEFAVVRDARSLAEGFNRILDRFRGDVLILCHDDVEVLAPRIDGFLAQALCACDIVGVAGSERAGGPAVLWTGHPHVHGWVSYPRDGAIEVAPLSMRSGTIPGMQTLDGVFMAMRAEVARALRFDEATFDGFHFYDLDLSYRAHRAGLRLAVSTDILLLHASEGRFEKEWAGYAQRFMDKFPELRGAQGKPHWYGARLPGRAQALAFYEKLRALDAETETA
jgi:Flp pilus assembly protein TadD